MRSKAALPLAQHGSAALSRALVGFLCLRELSYNTPIPTLLESAEKNVLFCLFNFDYSVFYIHKEYTRLVYSDQNKV